MKVHSYNTELKDRVLWSDGDSTISSDKIIDMVSKGVSPQHLFVDEITDSILQYNKLVPLEHQFGVKENIQPLSLDWSLPNDVQDINPWQYATDRLIDHLIQLNLIEDNGEIADEGKARVKRLTDEITVYKSLKLGRVLQAIIYIINTLSQHNVVWGVGRGSSVSSYLLFLIGVHDIDSYKYDLDIEEFLHD